MEDWEYTWCGDKCRIKSEEKIGLSTIMKKIFNALTPEERSIISDAFDYRDDNETLFFQAIKLMKYAKNEGDIK
jgi:hypothetical protein